MYYLEVANDQRRLLGLKWLGSIALVFLAACNSPSSQPVSRSLNSRYHEEQPDISGDGRTLVFISNRNGNNQIYVYDLQQRHFLDLPGLNRTGEIAQTPSISRTGRYIVYISSIEGRPNIVLYDRAVKRSQNMTERYRSWVRNPRISPNGRYIVFETARRGQWDIEVLDRGTNIELDIANGSRVTNI
ncbi:TolB family protein [Myxosarcina sp. GI1]|uniref:TolB family protein n=1 Tax=Myxosarcina sp. GI1 TaxID=1541065 RepID=UPI0005611A75|nr:TolB family protein [Myxosarcina sp. GI1]